jgi:hypothetical protein
LSCGAGGEADLHHAVEADRQAQKEPEDHRGQERQRSTPEKPAGRPELDGLIERLLKM